MGDPDELRKGEAPWKKMSKEVGGLQGEAGAEEYSSEIRWELQERKPRSSLDHSCGRGGASTVCQLPKALAL